MPVAADALATDSHQGPLEFASAETLDFLGQLGRTMPSGNCCDTTLSAPLPGQHLPCRQPGKTVLFTQVSSQDCATRGGLN